MHFDDRLETVLRLPDSGDGLARIQYQQLVDILGRLSGDARSDALEEGFARLDSLSARIARSDRARLLRQPLQAICNPRLLALLAQDEPEVASAAIASARLQDAEWLRLIPALPVQARGILRHRRDLSPPVEALLDRLGVHDRGLPPATMPSAKNPALEDGYFSDDVLELLDLADTPAPPTSLSEWARARAAREQVHMPSAAASADAGIGAIVRRIEEFRKARESQYQSEPNAEAPRLPLGDVRQATQWRAAAIDFATDAEGRIDWADGPHGPAVIGLSLGSADTGTALQTALRHRQPLSGMALHLDGAPAVSGDWQLDAVPRFDTASGRFTGYCGRLRRPALPAPADTGATDAEALRMREILHELRTPANAIQVAAEIIQQQLYGPAPHEYRALAAAIASDCAHILAGFEELDRLVKLETGALALDAGECDVAQVLAQTVARLRSWTDPRRSGFAVAPDTAPTALPVGLDQAEAERLIWRLFAALAGATAPDEPLALTWALVGNRVIVRIGLPAALVGRDDGDMFGTPPGERGQSLSAGMFGIGFTLRLAAAEATAAGGGLQRDENTLILWLPGLPSCQADNSTFESYSH